ncbi:MAG: DUF512 domain-containing protein [Actinobacteria bacterium]|nr:DUF512 domain-containing protein [Actinomycetota bacterium]MBU1942905.1 DUF512 domain-containing protein [Actinomycetota bacterium]MBU2687637.1 DUF512 domain-containing protein [Actinomycetota bacterium]
MSRSDFGPAIVERVALGSAAQEAGLCDGDRILTVDGESMRDLIDFSLLLADDVPHVLRVDRGGSVLAVELGSGGNPGVDLAEPVFGRVRTCNNRCVFCFVDQLPAGLRPSVYLKDDDYRLSFLCGNFVTLTNLSAADLERIVEDRLSPLYVSLHATDPALRREIFASRRATGAMTALEALLEAGIEIHLQIVLMKGVNDGEALDATLSDLRERYLGAASIGVVPVGVSDLAPEEIARTRFDAGAAAFVLEQLEGWRPTFGAAGPYPADEFFYLAGWEVPAREYYFSLPQIENGIGPTRVFRDGFYAAADRGAPSPGRMPTAVVSGPMGAWALSLLGIEEMGARVVVCPNTLFGSSVTVTGLLPGADVLTGLENGGFERALVSRVCLDACGRFIDGMSVEEVSRRAETRIECISNDGGTLLEALAGD